MATKGGGVTINFSVNAANYSAGVQKILQMNKQVAQSAKEAGRATVSTMQASSAAIRSLENPLNGNLRAVERFISTIPGVGQALQAAFPVVGAVALGTVIARTTAEVVQFVARLNAMPRAISDGFTEINANTQTTNDQMALANDTLRNHIALLEHKPENNLAIAFDEARIAADKLSASLRRDQAEVAKLLKENSIGFFGTLLGKASTSEIAGSINYGEQELADLGNLHDQAVQNGDSKKAADALATLKAKQAYYAKWARDQQTMRTGRMSYRDDGSIEYGPNGVQPYAGAGNQDDNLAILRGFQSDISKAQSRLSLEADNPLLASKEKKLSGDVEAARKAGEAQRKAFEQGFAKLEAGHESAIGGPLGQDGVIEFWKNAQAETVAGSDNFLMTQEKIMAALNTQWRQRSETIRKQAEEYKQWKNDLDSHQEEFNKPNLLSKAQYEESDKLDEAAEKYVENWAKLNAQQALNKAMMDEATLQINEARGAVTAHSAAIARASIDTARYNVELEKLQTVQGVLTKQFVAADASGNKDEKAKIGDKLLQNKQQQEELTGSYQAQKKVSDAAIADSSFEGQWTTTLSRMSLEFTDFGHQLTSTFSQTIANVNEEISRLLTTRHQTGYSTRQQFKAVGKSAASGLVNVGLQGAEGLALKSLGFGKETPGSSPSNALWVKLASTTATMAGIGGGLSRVVSGAASSAGGFLSHFAAAAGIAGFASGGPVSAGMTALIGENGPELMHFGQGGTIIPNDQISFGGGGNHTHHNYIDARGSTNPAETRKQIMQALAQAQGPLVRRSVKSVQEYNRRRPTSMHR